MGFCVHKETERFLFVVNAVEPVHRQVRHNIVAGKAALFSPFFTKYGL